MFILAAAIDSNNDRESALFWDLFEEVKSGSDSTIKEELSDVEYDKRKRNWIVEKLLNNSESESPIIQRTMAGVLQDSYFVS